MSVEHNFRCYKLWVAPLLLKSFRNSNKELNKKLNELALAGEWLIFDRIINFVVKEDRLINSDKILNFILNKEYEQEVEVEEIGEKVIIENRFYLLDFD